MGCVEDEVSRMPGERQREREREREGERERVCVCVCVRERERERSSLGDLPRTLSSVSEARTGPQGLVRSYSLQETKNVGQN